MKTNKIAVVFTTLSLAISGSLLAASGDSNLKKRITPPGKGPVIEVVPFSHDGSTTSVKHTIMRNTAPPGKGFVRSRSNSR